MNPHTFPKGHFALLMKVNIMAASIEVNEVIKVGGIQNTLVLWQAVFLAASPLAMAAPPPKLYFALSRSPYRQLRRLWLGLQACTKCFYLPCFSRARQLCLQFSCAFQWLL